MEPMNSTAARPTGITILAILAAIGGVFGLLGGLALLAGGAMLGSVGDSSTSALGSMAAVVGLVTLALAIAYLAFAFGGWTLKPWAWMLGMVIAGASIIWQVITAFLSNNLVGSLISVNGIIGLAIPIIILYYLNTPAVKSAFGRA